MSEDNANQGDAPSLSVSFLSDAFKLLNDRHPGRKISTDVHLQLVILLAAIDRVYQELPLETPKNAVGFAAAKRGEK